MKGNASFYQKQAVEVLVYADGKVLSGKLNFGGFKYPVFILNNRLSNESHLFTSYMSNKDSLICTSISNDEVFTLNEINVEGPIVTAKFLRLGKHLQSFNTFELGLTGVSVWIESNRGFHFNGECLERDFNTDKFSESFNFDSERYNMSNNYHIETNSDVPTECFFRVNHTLVIKKEKGCFSLSECEKVSHEIRNLLSLLTGASLSVNEVWIYDDNQPHKHQFLYYPTVLYAQEPLRHAFEALTSFANITNEKMWSAILYNYFSKDSFRDIWSRIVPSYNEAGIWEYDILSRVVTLEMYAVAKTTARKLSLSKGLNREFMKELKNTIDCFSSSRAISGNDLIVFTGMANSILSTKNTSLPTLREKFDELMQGITPALRSAISFTDNDFKRIKKIRDSTAHGLSYHKNNPGNDITHEIQLNDRLLVLLICFAYLELGFTEKEIALFIKNSHAGFIRNAGTNKRELDKMIGKALFVTLTEQPKRLSLESHQIVVLSHSIEAGNWYLLEDITLKARTEWHSSGYSDLIDYVKSIVSQNKEENFELHHEVYVESGGSETEHFLSIIISS